MKKSQNNTRRDGITRLPIMPGTLVLCGCTLLIFAAILIAMYRGGMLAVPDFLAGFLGSDRTDDGGDSFAEDFLASLSGNAPALDGTDEKLLSMSPDALKELLLACTPYPSYYQVYDVTWTDGSSVFRRTQVYYIVSESRVHAEIFPNDGMPRRFTCDETRFYFEENGVSRLLPRGEFTPEGEAGIPSLSRLQQMIAEAGEGRYTLSLAIADDSPCIRVTLTDPLTGVGETYDVLPDYGLIISASLTLPGVEMQHYQVNTTALLTDPTGLAESTFDIPNP